ncbi:MAG: leucine--tRNA ligase [Firmicutes bacterium]|nr:leucine--tRNA ligase [Bacillota bacterium]
MSTYNHKQVEKRWRNFWQEHNISSVKMDLDKPKYYCLDMFPYPSGSGLHVGHWRGYVLSDVFSRYKTLQGYQVLHPMGWDAFGLPAENDAINKGIHPTVSTASNIANFKRQLQEIGAMYNWDREINTTDPDYYKWTQWIFLKMFERGLAYQKEMPINFCPSCQTGLANEEVVGGECERCGSQVEKRKLKQWMLKITAYADRLLEGLKQLEWPEKVLKMQEAWIGRSEGAEIDFYIQDMDEKISVFTTRPDTLFGATFMVLAPEHELVEKLTTDEYREQVEEYIRQTQTKSSVERMANKDKTGVFTGSYAINPVNDRLIPIWISDYVLIDYGSGAVMAVPAHDERDYEFAQVFGLDIIPVIADLDGIIPELPFVMDGILINSGKFDGLSSKEAKDSIVKYLAEEGRAVATVQYKMRDWVFSRQRYWGEPIPIVHCDSCGQVPVPESELPVRLPDVKNYQPTGTGESPLAAIEEWVNTTCPACGGKAKRETNTMPQWAGSCWYFLRYVDPHNNEALADKEKIKYWLPVDLYVGGVEHAVLHLLYARFYTMFLKDIGVVEFDEPFKKLFNQGMITKDGAKMSKSKGNVVNPDELVEHYGADALRIYELFIGPPEIDAEWMDNGIEGVYRFIQRVWAIVENSVNVNIEPTRKSEQLRHRLIKTITERLESFKLNTVVSAFMEYVNEVSQVFGGKQMIDRKSIETLAILLAPLAPHFAEEIWAKLGNENSIFVNATWPSFDPEMLVVDEVTIAVQVNGKTRGTVTLAVDANEETAKAEAFKITAVNNALEGKEIVKTIYVKGKILNIVVK